MSDLMQHIAADCPQCKEGLGVPLGFHEGDFEHAIKNPDRLLCAVCGHDWRETNAEQLARAWFGIGAYEGRVEMEIEQKEAAQ